MSTKELLEFKLSNSLLEYYDMAISDDIPYTDIQGMAIAHARNLLNDIVQTIISTDIDLEDLTL